MMLDLTRMNKKCIRISIMESVNKKLQKKTTFQLVAYNVPHHITSEKICVFVQGESSIE